MLFEYYTNVKVWKILQTITLGLQRILRQDHTAGVLIKGSNLTVLATILLSLHPQVSSHVPCYAPRSTHFLTVNPSQISCQVIIYTRSISVRTQNHISPISAVLRLAEARCFRVESSCTSMISHGGTPLAFWLRSSLDNKA